MEGSLNDRREIQGPSKPKTKAEIEDWMLSQACTRDTVIIALGGGGSSGGQAEVTLQGSVETLVLQAGTDGCVSWSTATGCSGSKCGLQPGTTIEVTCDDPILAEWPQEWTLLDATWSAPSLQASGSIVVEPATAYVVDPQHGGIVTDPGFSAYVMHLDVSDLPPTTLVLTAVFADVLQTYDPIATDAAATLARPTEDHWLGTDHLGRDIFSRVLYGGRKSLPVGLVAIGLAAIIGVAFGLIAGYYGNWVDSFVMRCVDLMLAFPGILLAMALVAILGSMFFVVGDIDK